MLCAQALCSYLFKLLKFCPIVNVDHELLELAASFQSSPGRPVTKYMSMARRVRSALRLADRPRFVAAFCQTNCGDVSPNVLGAFCIDTGLPCDFNHSTCDGKNELCYGRGPGYLCNFILSVNYISVS